MLTVRCPQCNHDMRYEPKLNGNTVVGKKKRCVYCGMTFAIHSNLPRSRIVAIGAVEEKRSPSFVTFL